ncbi:MAG TPA: nucleoid-associated protein [Thermoanaerobaculia bacterium]|nr:nucleoid-associated protein [Thermoanaerobaculia bacterium]
MTNNPGVTVQRAIAHITDRADEAPVLSEIELDLAAAAKLGDYFSGQVQHATDDEQTSAARFAADEPHDARDACYRILDDEGAFISASQQLARLLHAAMRTHHRSGPGLLAVCVYTHAGDPALTRRLALIKLDPGSGLVQRVENRQGKRLVTFDVLDNVMPSTSEKLQKAALLPAHGSENYDLRLLDRQTSEVAADFWKIAFLNAELIVDGKLGARVLRDVSYKASDDLAKQGVVTAAQAEEMKEQTDLVLRRPQVKRSAFVRRLPIPKEAKEVVAARLEQKFAGTETIPVDVPYASSKLTNKRKYRGSYGVTFEVESDHWNDVVKLMEQFVAPDGTPMTRLVLEIPRLQKVK